MKKRVLLIDESLTVQKVVALTLDRNRYSVLYAKSRGEAMKEILQSPPDLILASDQVADISVSSFPKEVESWVGRERRMPPIVLITGQDLKEARHYKGVLRKPFSPQALQAVVVEHTRGVEEAPAAERGTASGHEEDDHRLQKIFNDTFADEAKLTRETFENESEDDERTLLTIPAPPPPRGAARPVPKKVEPKEEDDVWAEEEPESPPPPVAAKGKPGRTPPPPPPETAAELWGAHQKGNSAAGASGATAIKEPPAEIMGAEDSVAYKAVLEKQVESHLREQDLDEVVDRLLKKIVPPIVEKLVQERLDRLLKEQENFVELKP